MHSRARAQMEEIISRLLMTGHPDRGLSTLAATVSHVETPALQVCASSPVGCPRHAVATCFLLVSPVSASSWRVRALDEQHCPQVATKLLGRLAAASPAAIVEAHLSRMLPPLVRAFSHPHADVRKVTTPLIHSRSSHPCHLPRHSHPVIWSS